MSSPLFDRRTSHVVPWAVVLAALCLPAARAAGDAFPFPTFSAPFQIAESLNGPGFLITPATLVVGRFDADPRADILAVNSLEAAYPGYYQTGFSRMSGDGQGRFTLGSIELQDGSAGDAAIAAADFNGDGITDIVFSSYDEIEIGLYDAGGAVHFSTVLTTDERFILRSGDFDGDGKQDFVGIGQTPDIIRVFLGHGDGTFQALPDVPLPQGTEWMVVGDVDGDGDLDVVLSRYVPTCPSANGTTLLNDSHGVLTVSGQPAAPDCLSRPVELVDLDGDGHVDLLEEKGTRLGNGDGTFRARSSSWVGWFAAAGDFDEDGIPDVAVVDGSVLRTMRGNGDGTFSTTAVQEAGLGPRLVRAADLNEDGHLDLAVQTQSSPVALLFGDGHGHFGGPQGIPAGQGVRAIVARDLDRDGKVDLVVVASESNAIATLKGRGDGSFDAPVFHVTGLNPTHAIAADVNGDGRLDVVVSNYTSGTLSFFPGMPDGTLGSRTDIPALLAERSVAVGDVNEDGRLDLVAAGDGEFLVLLNAAGGFRPGYRREIGILHPIGLADWDGDGHLDLAANPNDMLSGSGDGTFPQECYYCSPCGSVGDPCFHSAALGDMNADCVADLAFGVNWDPFRGGQAYSVGMTSPISNNRLSGTPVHSPGALAIGDFNGDGRSDLATAQAEGLVSIFFNNGTGGLTSRLDFGTGRAAWPPVGPSDDPARLAAADFNGDGRLDLAVACRGSNAVFIHLNGGSTPPPPPGLEAQAASGGEASLDLSWDRPVGAVAGYRIYYDMAGHSPLAGNQAKEGSSPISTQPGATAFSLHCLADKKFAVRVVAVDGLGREQQCLPPALEATPLRLGGTLRVEPGGGHWLTMNLSLHQGFTPEQVLVSSIRLDGVGPPVRLNGGGARPNELRLRFDRSAIDPVIADGRFDLTGRVLGCRDTLSFAVRDTLGTILAMAGTPGERLDQGPDAGMPIAFALRPISPNPVARACDLSFDLPRQAHARLRIFDLSGRQVAELLDGALPGGTHRLRWETGRVPRGLYFLKLEAGDFVATRRFTVVE